MIKPRKLAHIVLSVRDAQAAKNFYVKVLGLLVAAESQKKDQVFMSFGKEHHDLAVFQRATGAPREEQQPGLTHIAWQVDSRGNLEAIHNRLQTLGIPAEAVRQGDVLSRLFLRDPDGNLVELYCGRWDDGIEAMLARASGTRPAAASAG
jgi:catechol-2,3-dioxygenase